jgi:hypothetical protein
VAPERGWARLPRGREREREREREEITWAGEGGPVRQAFIEAEGERKGRQGEGEAVGGFKAINGGRFHH